MTIIDLQDLHKITNDVYYPLYLDKHRFEVLYGSAGSGKSIFAGQKILFRILVERDHRFLVIRKVGATLRDSVFKQLIDIIDQWGLISLCAINKSDFSIKFPAFNSEILCKGLDDAEKLKSITGITSIWIEEATELSENDFKEINRRLRGITAHYKQIMLTFNPIDINLWHNKKFIIDKDDRTLTLKTTYKDNRFLDKEYIIELESEKDEILYNIYTLGEWGVYKGVIFTNWEVCDLTEKLPLYQDKLRHGLDFGVNDPLAVGKIAVDLNKKEIYIFDEIYKTGVPTNQAIAELIRPMVEKRPVICDNSEPKSITELQNYGINAIACTKGKDSVIAGIKFLRQFKIFVDFKCKNAANELRTYRWREDKHGNTLDEPVDMHNHFIDGGLRYACEDLIGQYNILSWDRF
jgi:phage terminase large subunit